MGPKEVIANLNRRVRLPDGYEGRFTGATIRKDESGICRLEDVEVVP